MESVSTEGTLLSAQHRHASLVVLAVVTAAGLLVTRRGPAFSTVAAPVVALLILVSQWLRILDPAGADNMAFYHWPLLVPHIVLVFVALACFATSAISAALDWYQRRLMAARSAKVLELNTPALDTLALISRLAGLVGLTALIAAMLIGFTHLVALYAAMAQIGTEGNLGYLVPRVAAFPGDDGRLVGVLRLVVPRALGCVGAGSRCPRHRRPCGGGAARRGVGGNGAMGLFVAGVNPRRSVFSPISQRLADGASRRVLLAEVSAHRSLSEGLIVASGACVELYAVAGGGLRRATISPPGFSVPWPMGKWPARSISPGIDAASHLFAALCGWTEFARSPRRGRRFFGKATRFAAGDLAQPEGRGIIGAPVRRTRCPHAGRVPCRRHGGRARWATAWPARGGGLPASRRSVGGRHLLRRRRCRDGPWSSPARVRSP